ncbi:spore germination protein GerPC, partial [Bacillus pumilus]|uniref:spore germination protein GerPC n=1 Tax=Bacillus pumilus TaxID=1408 RepID=UPI001C92C1F6
HPFLNQQAPQLLEQLQHPYEPSLHETNKHHIIHHIPNQIDSTIKYYPPHLPHPQHITPLHPSHQIPQYLNHDLKPPIQHFLPHIPNQTKPQQNPSISQSSTP